ncbi:MAG: hypothetical protein QM698_01020 [Micropepsaceae bacterium]
MGTGKIIGWLTAAVWLTGAVSAAVEAEAIPMTDGPNGSGRSLGSAWSMACGPGLRLVGVKVYEDGRTIAGVEALCAALEWRPGRVIAWASGPAVAELPERMPLRPVVVAAEGTDDLTARTVLRASSREVRRQSGSRAVLIQVAPAAPEPVWTQEPGRRVTLATGRKGRELVCPEGTYVQGLRTGSEAGRRGGLVAVQIVCGSGNGRVETVGVWADPRKSKKNKPLRPVVAMRTQCGGGAANPHDGMAAKALIGTAEDGRIVSLGLTCAKSAVPGVVSLAVGAVTRWLSEVAPAVKKGSVRVYRAPNWYAGSDVAVCRDGSGRGPCAQASADRFCVTMTGAGRASFYVVGRVSGDAIAAGGKRCPSGVCRAFQQITCAG